MTLDLHLRLTHKIAAIACVGIAGLAVVGLIYEFGSRSQDSSRAIAAQAQEMADLGRKLSIGMLEQRREEKNFLIRKQDRYANGHAARAPQIVKDFDTLAQLLKASGRADLVAANETVRKGFAEYTASFAALVDSQRQLGLDENAGLSGSLRRAVHAAEKALQVINQPVLTSHMLMMRRHEKDFMLRGDTKYVAELKKVISQFSTSLTDIGVDQAESDKVLQLFAQYFRDFNAWANVAGTRTSHENAMMTTFRAIEPVFADVIKQVEAYGAEALATERQTHEAMHTLMLTAIALTVTGMVILGFLIWPLDLAASR